MLQSQVNPFQRASGRNSTVPLVFGRIDDRRSPSQDSRLRASRTPCDRDLKDVVRDARRSRDARDFREQERIRDMAQVRQPRELQLCAAEQVREARELQAQAREARERAAREAREVQLQAEEARELQAQLREARSREVEVRDARFAREMQQQSEQDHDRQAQVREARVAREMQQKAEERERLAQVREAREAREMQQQAEERERQTQVREARDHEARLARESQLQAVEARELQHQSRKIQRQPRPVRHESPVPKARSYEPSVQERYGVGTSMDLAACPVTPRLRVLHGVLGSDALPRSRARNPSRDRREGTTRVRSIDSSIRSLPGRTSDRAVFERRGSAPISRTAPVSCDDTAEYSDRFLAGYDRERLLGRGACAVVWLAVPTGTADAVAVKQVVKGTTGKKRSDTESARKEMLFGSYFFGPGGDPKMSKVQYPGICHLAKLLDHSETKKDIWLVMEYGGTCLTKMAYEIKGEFLRGERVYRVIHLPLLQRMKRDVRNLKQMLRQLLSALSLLADHHIVHSDIKPDNIVIEEDENQQLKCRFIDLGSAFTFDCPEKLSLATPEYMPPEALETCCGRSSGRLSTGRGAKPDPSEKLKQNSHPWSLDMWALGSILLELSLGTPLWLSYKARAAEDQRPNSAATGLFAVPGRDPEKILTRQSEALRQRGLQKVLKDGAGVALDGDATAVELLEAMLAWDPLNRISPKEALDGPFLSA